MATARFIADGGEVFGVPNFILFTFIASGDDLFLFRFLPPLGVFGVFLLEPMGFNDLGGDATTLSSIICATAGDDLVFDLAAAGLAIIRFSTSETSVKLKSAELLLFALYDFLLADLEGDFFPDLDAGRDFLADLGVVFVLGDLFPFGGDKDLALLGVDLADADFEGTVWGV